MTASAERRRRIAIAGLVATVALFVLELVALALGWYEVALACGAIFFAGWFVLRSFMKRGAPPES